MHGFRLPAGRRKCARVVGEVLGKFHPHGDTAVYDALVSLCRWEGGSAFVVVKVQQLAKVAAVQAAALLAR